MARYITTAAAAALAASTKSLALLAQAEFATGTVYLWTGLGPVTWNGNTFQGTGGFIEFGSAPETEQVMAQTVLVTVSGIDPSIMAFALGEGGHNLSGELWLAFIDGSGAIIADPIPLYAGQLDTIGLVETASGPSIQLTYQNRLADLERPRLYNYTDTDQQLLSPGDLGFQFVPQAVEWSGTWGSGAGVPGTVGGTQNGGVVG